MAYADFLVDCCNRFKIEKLDKIQKRAVKIIDRFAHERCKI